jgi:protein tyrosine phosphatase
MLRHAKLTDNCNIARLPENKAKNRFRNVLPYDATRVYLTGPDDYINASHIRIQVGKKQLHYIACQGPLPQTTGDFWRMVWEQKADVIAMVTLVTESGKVKCHHYWPDSISAPFTICNRFEISLTQVQRLESFDIHHIKMEDLESGRIHRVTHLNFTGWPDHGSPESGLPLLKYIHFMNLVHDSGAIVVHCSAGIGRTGTLLTLDITKSMIESDIKFDIHKIVNDLRRQRQGMIQTKDQYMFVYKATKDALISVYNQQNNMPYSDGQ